MVHLTTALDASSGVPLYEQLYRSLAGEMRSGTLAAGTRMPGKRRLAAELSVSVNTVDAAYQMLAAEGYLESRERSGFYVQEYLALPSRPAGGPEQPAPPKPEPPALPVRYDLSTRRVDPELFPFRTWARLQKELLYSSPQLLTHGDAQGDPALRQALAEYLSEYRGVQCGPHQIVVGAGLEYLLGLLAPLLPGPAAVETPGYPRALQVLQNNGVHCCCLPVDEDGLSVEALNRSDAAVCYVTPSHQFPTGVTMPAGRRAELLHWAARRPGGRYIIEDDYDSEFRFDTRPLPSLQGMAGADGPVVYLSTCSRSLAPQHPYRLYGAAGASSACMAEKIPPLLRHGEPVRAADAGPLYHRGLLHPASGPGAGGLQGPAGRAGGSVEHCLCSRRADPCGPAHRPEPAGKAQRPAAGCCAALRGGSRRRAAEPAERLRPDRRSTLSGGHAGAGLWLAEGRGLRLGG